MAVRIEQELPESARTAAAELYWEAFGRLLRPALGRSEHGIDILTDGLDPSRAIAALDGDELVGLIGLHYGGRAFTRLGARSLLRHLGLAGVPRLVPLLLLAGRPPAGELRIDGIAVRADRRGAGIGSLLLREAAARARAVGIEVIRLEVVDTNPRARSLYEREGYVAVRTERTPYLRRAMGFGAVTTMERRVG
jgi:ribosomal protein S18 acetylase RimI-like enzyme